MPKTTLEIWKDRSNKYKTAKWYSEEELIKAIDELWAKKGLMVNDSIFMNSFKKALKEKLGLKR